MHVRINSVGDAHWIRPASFWTRTKRTWSTSSCAQCTHQVLRDSLLTAQVVYTWNDNCDIIYHNYSPKTLDTKPVHICTTTKPWCEIQFIHCGVLLLTWLGLASSGFCASVSAFLHIVSITPITITHYVGCSKNILQRPRTFAWQSNSLIILGTCNTPQQLLLTLREERLSNKWWQTETRNNMY